MSTLIQSVDPLLLHRSAKEADQKSKTKEKSKKPKPTTFRRKGNLKANKALENNTFSGVAYFSETSAIAMARQTLQWKYKFMIRHVEMEL